MYSTIQNEPALRAFFVDNFIQPLSVFVLPQAFLFTTISTPQMRTDAGYCGTMIFRTLNTPSDTVAARLITHLLADAIEFPLHVEMVHC